MQNDFECLGEIDEIEKIISCKKNIDKFKKMGISQRRKKITEKELLNRRLYRELFQYRFNNY